MLLTLWRYSLRELGKWLLPSFLIFSFVVLLFWVLRIARAEIGAVTMLQVLPLIFPFIASYILPPTILTGTIMCYGRLAGDNEYAAAQAGGIWPGWLVAPSFAIGLVATFVTLYLNEAVLTYATREFDALWVKGSVQVIEGRLDQQGVVRLGNYHLYRFPTTDGRQALDMSVYKPAPDRPAGGDSASGAGRWASLSQRVFALHHWVEVEPLQAGGQDQTLIRLHLEDCHMQSFQDDGAVRHAWADAAVPQFKIEADVESPISGDRVQCWDIGRLLERMRELRTRYRERTEAAGTAAAIEAARQDFEKSMGKCRRALHTRLGLSFSCLIFALVGTFLGITMQRAGRSELFAVGFGIYAAYFLFLILCRSFVAYGGWVLWLPNLLLLGVALILWRRVFWVV